MILSGWPEDICDVPMDLYPYHHAHDVLTVEDGIILCGEALVIPPLERDNVLWSNPWRPPRNNPNANTMPTNVFIGLATIETSNTPLKHVPHTNAITHQEPWQPLKPTPAPECTWQHLGADFMHFDGNEYLIIIDYYSKMPFVYKITPIPNAMLPRQYPFWRNCLLSMGIPGVTLQWQWPPVCKHPLCRICHWLELQPLHQCTYQPSQ